MKNIAVILGHPSGEADTFCFALADAYEKGAIFAGYNVSFINIGQLEIEFLRQRSDYQTMPLSPDLLLAQDEMRTADHWVIIYPLWLGTMPAMLKAFLERIMSPGFAYNEQNRKNPAAKKPLQGKSARIIVTMGMPDWFYKWFYGAHSLKSLERNILKFCGISPVRKTLLGFVDGMSDKKRKKWLDRTYSLGKSGL